MVTILISATFKGAEPIRGEELIRGRHLFKSVPLRERRLLEGGAYLRPSTY